MPQEKEPGWQDWLASQGILDLELTEQQSYLRYLKFHKMTFPAVPRDKWYHLFADLALLEQCFVVGGAIGEVHEFPFVFDLVEPDKPIRAKPIVYPPHARQWLK